MDIRQNRAPTTGRSNLSGDGRNGLPKYLLCRYSSTAFHMKLSFTIARSRRAPTPGVHAGRSGFSLVGVTRDQILGVYRGSSTVDAADTSLADFPEPENAQRKPRPALPFPYPQHQSIRPQMKAPSSI